MSSEILGGETPIIKRAADGVADLAMDIRYLEGASGFHLEGDKSHEEAVSGSMEMIHHHRSAEYGAKIALSALTSMEIIGEDFDAQRFTEEVEKIRAGMKIEHHASAT